MVWGLVIALFAVALLVLAAVGLLVWRSVKATSGAVGDATARLEGALADLEASRAAGPLGQR